MGHGRTACPGKYMAAKRRRFLKSSKLDDPVENARSSRRRRKKIIPILSDLRIPAPRQKRYGNNHT